MSGTVRLLIKIDTNQIIFLRENGYKLCIAKKVNGAYRVVWLVIDEFLLNNTLHWPRVSGYDVFGSTDFKVGQCIKKVTNSVAIGFGQVALLDAHGELQPPDGPVDESDRFEVKNLYGRISFGVGCEVNGENRPVYVGPVAIVGTEKFVPKNQVKLWFERDVETSQMIKDAPWQSFEVDLEGTSEMAVQYGGPEGSGIWSIV